MMAVLAILLPTWAAFGILKWFDQTRGFSYMETVAYSFLTGQLLLVLTFFAFSFTSGAVPTGLLMVFFLICGCTGPVKSLWYPVNRVQDQVDLRPNNAFGIIMSLFFFILVSFSIIRAGLTPIKAYDGFAIYAPKAISIFQNKAITRELLLAPLPHPDYPLLIPVSEAWQCLVSGEWSESRAKMIFPCFLLAAGVILAGAVVRHRNADWGWTAAFLLAGTPVVYVASSQALCDFPTGVFILAGTAVWWNTRDSRRASVPALTVMMLAAAAWTKNEGLPMALVVLGIISLYSILGNRTLSIKRWFRLAPGWLSLMVLISPWWILKSSLKIGNELITSTTVSISWIVDHLDRIPYLIRYFAYEMVYSTSSSFAGGRWLLGWTFFWLAFCLTLFRLKKNRLIYLGSIVLCQLGVFFVIYVITPYHLQYQLRTALDRLLLQIFPTSLLFTILVLSTSVKNSHDPPVGTSD